MDKKVLNLDCIEQTLVRSALMEYSSKFARKLLREEDREISLSIKTLIDRIDAIVDRI